MKILAIDNMQQKQGVTYSALKATKKRLLFYLWRIEQFFKNTWWFLRIQRPFTLLLGSAYKRNHDSIEIDITRRCNLKCLNCDMSCTQAPGNEDMDIKQIQKFIKDNINNNIRWKRIRILGGEPLLHPQILEIIRLLVEYKHRYSPDVHIQVVTNGFGKKVNELISRLPKNVEIENSSKGSIFQSFKPFNIAPGDCLSYRYADYSNGCRVLYDCGVGLTPHGYYPCIVAGGIDRIFGFDKGRKNMPLSNDSMADQLQVFCKLCGHFRSARNTKKSKISPTWKKAYEEYKMKKPALSLY
jgi:uncharacterized Fe-S cluster-containing radical SAM superfamily protein